MRVKNKNKFNDSFKPIKKVKTKKDYESLLRKPDEKVNLIHKYNMLNKRVLYKIDELLDSDKLNKNSKSIDFLNLSRLLNKLLDNNMKVFKTNNVTLEDVNFLENIYNQLYPEID